MNRMGARVYPDHWFHWGLTKFFWSTCGKKRIFAAPKAQRNFLTKKAKFSRFFLAEQAILVVRRCRKAYRENFCKNWPLFRKKLTIFSKFSGKFQLNFLFFAFKGAEAPSALAWDLGTPSNGGRNGITRKYQNHFNTTSIWCKYWGVMLDDGKVIWSF